MSRRSPDVIVIGAGPYGLAATAHLREIGADVHTIGVPMSFWRGHMPKGMLLRSAWGASHIADPRAELTLEAFERTRGAPLPRPIPLPDFIAYGEWFARQAAPDVDGRVVRRVDATGSGFRVEMEDGQPIKSSRVVVAAGIKDFAWWPREFAQLPPEMVSHSSAETDLGRFAGDRVVVIGGGQSAIESAALLGESGAEVELLMRTRRMHWVGRATREGLLGRMLFHRSDVGPAMVSQVVARPDLMRRLPGFVQRSLTRRSLVPGGAGWLKDRLGEVRITTGRRIAAVARANGHVRIRLDDGAEREVDHVFLATGYHVDVKRYRFFAPELVAKIRCVDGLPVLDAGLQTSVAGLHVLGAPGVHSFGPVVRFVCGTEYTGRALARGLSRGASADRAPHYAPSEEAAS